MANRKRGGGRITLVSCLRAQVSRILMHTAADDALNGRAVEEDCSVQEDDEGVAVEEARELLLHCCRK